MFTRLGLLVILWLSLCGFNGPGRFRPGGPGPLGKVVTQVRTLIRPAYEIRGALLQLQLECLAARGTPEQKAMIQPWLEVGLADSGWLAFELNKAIGAAKTEQDETVKNVASVLAGSKAEDSSAKAAFRRLVRGEAGDFKSALQVTPEQLAAHLQDPAALARMQRLAKGIDDAVDHLAKSIQNSVKVAKTISAAVSKEGALIKKAMKGDAEAAAQAALQFGMTFEGLQDAYRDVSRLGRLWQAIATDGTAIAAMPASVSLASLGDALAADQLRGFAAIAPKLEGFNVDIASALAGELAVAKRTPRPSDPAAADEAESDEGASDDETEEEPVE